MLTHRVAGIGFEPMTSGLWARRASRLLHPAIVLSYSIKSNGQRWIRTIEASCSRFTVCPLWPLGNLPIIQFNIKLYKADDRTRTDNLLITNQLLCQLSHIGIRLMTFNSAHCCAKNDSNGIWTRVTAVKGRCLNRLTMEPKKKKTPRVGLEPTTTRLTAECSTIELSRIIKVCTFKTSYKSDLFFSVINQIKPSTY